MLAAIDFDDEAGVHAEEIEDVAIERYLSFRTSTPPTACPAVLATTYSPPAWILAHGAGKLAVFRRNGLSHGCNHEGKQGCSASEKHRLSPPPMRGRVRAVAKGQKSQRDFSARTPETLVEGWLALSAKP